MKLTWNRNEDPLVDPCMKFRFDVLTRQIGRDALEKAWWTVLLDLGKSDLEGFIGRAESAGLVEALRVPDVYGQEARSGPRAERFVTIFARKALLDELNRIDGDNTVRESMGVERVLAGSIVPDELFGRESPAVRDEAPIELDPGSVVIAVIDNGIAFGHDLFRQGDDSRVRFAWIMEGQAAAMVGVGPGVRWSKPQIDQALRDNTRSGLLDEDAFYRELGLIDFARPGFKPAAMRVSHGTHVMGLAAGSQDGPPNPPRPIICVELPASRVKDTSGADLAPDLNLAIDWILDRARLFRSNTPPKKRLPLVVNFSYGNFDGPHDGTGLIEEAIDSKLKPTGGDLIHAHLPAGNGNLNRCHAVVAFGGGGEGEGDHVVLDWRVLPDDRTASHVELWMPFDPPTTHFVDVTLSTPDGQTSGAVGAAFGAGQTLTRDGVEIARIDYRFVPGPTRRGLICISIAPTAGEDSSGLAPAGLWRITVAKAELAANQEVQCWIRRDETLPGFPPFGRQSYFDNACYVRFDQVGRPLPVDPPGGDCEVLRSGTLSGFATAGEPSVIAAYVRTDRCLSLYSAAGPVTPRQGAVEASRAGPDAAAVGDDSEVLDGILSAGSRSGSMVAMNGTSVATPQVARWVAVELGAGRDGGRTAVRTKAELDDPANPYRPERAGGGRMRLPFRFRPFR